MISPLLESIMLLCVVNQLIDDTIQLIFKLMKNSKYYIRFNILRNISA